MKLKKTVVLSLTAAQKRRVEEPEVLLPGKALPRRQRLPPVRERMV